MSRRSGSLRKWQLSLLLTGAIFIVMLLSLFIVLSVFIILIKAEIFPFELIGPGMFLINFSAVSLIVGIVLAYVLSRFSIRPIRHLIDAADRIASGDYSVRVHLGGPDEVVHLGNSFNHMAEELGSVEMLRSDFVNNFSHEFKTPIVSIRGFSRMLQYDDLSPEERTEYQQIIIDESERLTELATSVLALSRIEQQTILTGQKELNITEQIRMVIAMMDSKWHDKVLHFDFDCPEFVLTGNPELLQQVWINLIDNAIKFSPDEVQIRIDIHHRDHGIEVEITDHGIGMDEETCAHIFEKFYQADSSHATKGNGLGLSTTKRIVELHGGSLSVFSKAHQGTRFVVRLPENIE